MNSMIKELNLCMVYERAVEVFGTWILKTMIQQTLCCRF